VDVLLFDAMNLIRRIYAPQQDKPDAVESTLLLSQNAMLKDIAHFQPRHVACVFDGQGKTWRHQLYPAYKANRNPMPDALGHALPEFQRRFEQIGIRCLLYDDLEADDVIATLAVKSQQHGKSVVIVSTDKGYMQIMDDQTLLYHHFDRRQLNLDDVRSTLGFEPHQLIDFLSLVGDSTNEVPGVEGIGQKTAGKLLDQFGDLDSILIHSEEISGKVGRQLTSQFRTALRARKMVTLKTDCELGINLKSLRYQPEVYKSSVTQR